MRVQLFKEGKCVYDCPDLEEVRDYCKKQVSALWDEMLRFENPQTYYVDLSRDLWDLKRNLIHQYSAI